jgi:hypothetical protein
MRRLSRKVTVAILLALSSVIIAIILFVPPPGPVLQWIITSSAPLLLDGTDANETRITTLSKKVIRAYTNVATASYLARRVIAQGGTDDEILGRMMAEAREIVINPREPEQIRHDTTRWPALLSGVGYCDQLNAIVCRIAAHHFPKAQLVGLYAQNRRTPHTIGRVWSKQHKDWVYFDAFYAKPVMFTRDAAGMPRFLPTPGAKVMPSREVISLSIYRLPGWALSEFPSTFGMYIVDRILKGDPEAASAEDGSSQTAAAVPSDSAGSDDGPRGGMFASRPANLQPDVMPYQRADSRRRPEVFDRVVRAYAAARVQHLFHGENRNAYRAVAQQSRAAQVDDRAAEIASAADRFARLK